MQAKGHEMSAMDASEQSAGSGSILDVLIVLAKHKVLIFGTAGLSAVLALAICLLLPNIYTGTARLLPPQQSASTAAMLLGQLGGLASLAGNAVGIKNPNDMYVGMLKSRTVADQIIARFDLKRIYEKETMIETREELAKKTSITAGKDGLITIEFDDEDPVRAAKVANAYVEELEKLSQSLAVTEAAQRRLFFEQQLKQAKQALSDAEVELKTTQEKTGLIKLDDQGRAIIEAVATLRAQIAAKEIELSSMRTFATKDNPEYIRAQGQLAGLRAELAKLERKQALQAGDVLVPTGKVPEAGLEYLRKFRDVKYHEAVFELLAKQFEAAKIDEARESTLIQVVDAAVIPDDHSKPKRALIVIASMLSGGLLGVLLALIKGTIEHMRSDPSQANRLDALRRHIAFR